MSYQERLRTVFKRMKSAENRERYNSINLTTKRPEEEEIWKICQTFWGNNFTTTDICNVRDNMDPMKADMLLDRLEVLLNQLGWRE